MLTDAEMHVLDLTAQLTNAFDDLPDDHPRYGDFAEFVRHMHCIQDMVLARPTLRELSPAPVMEPVQSSREPFAVDWIQKK